MAVAYLGIGSNIGEKEINCKEALKRLKRADGIRLEEASQFYHTKPVGGAPQEDYLNGVLKIATELEPAELLNVLKGIEKEMERKISPVRNSPRVIDLDILLYDDLTIKTETLTIPHQRMHERMFVLKGLDEIAPGAVHPVLGKTVRELYENNYNDQQDA